jgi:hypothetical protein
LIQTTQQQDANLNIMSLLAQLATKVDRLNTELAATEALGLLLKDKGTATIFTELVRAGIPHLPRHLVYSTQAADVDGRPDLVARDATRECLHVECKYWAGLTEAQSRGAYLDRMRRQRAQAAPDHPHVGALLFVVPPRRTGAMRDELSHRFDLTAWRQFGQLEAAATADGVSVALATWSGVLEQLAASTDRAVAEDARQLLGLVEHIDNSSFVPWTIEDRTDQQTPRRILRLAQVIDATHTRLLRDGAAESIGRRTTITEGGPLAFGKRMKLGGVVCTLRLSLELWSRHGKTPLWLTFGSGAEAARRVFPDAVELSQGAAIPVPLPIGSLEDTTISTVVMWLATAGKLLQAAAALVPDDASSQLSDDEEQI